MGIFTDVKEQQTIALKVANIFSVSLGESVDKSNILRLVVVARYCCNCEVHEELCRLKATACMVFLNEKICSIPSISISKKERLIYRRYLQLQQTAHLIQWDNIVVLLHLQRKRLGTLLFSCTILFIKKILERRFQIQLLAM